MNKHEALKGILERLSRATEERDAFEIEYSLEKARLMFSAEVKGLGNQTQRESQVTLLLDEKGMYRKMAELRSKARLAYYEWSTFKALVEGN